MKVVLFCGGLGLRIRGSADDVPKPMVQIGSRPILWHVMKYYAHHGHKDFVLCLGHKGSVIKDYFLNYDQAASNDFIWSRGGKEIQYLNHDIDEWTITFVETGLNASIGQRLKAIEPHVQDEEMFLANYSDGLSDVSLPLMIEEFQRTGSIASLLLVRPTASFDIVNTDNDGLVTEVCALGHSSTWINGGFFVMRKEIFDYIGPGEELVREPFQRLIDQKKLYAHRHTGFWQCMDTFKDKEQLEEMNSRSNAPWKIWSEVKPMKPKQLEVFKVGA
jgi:glucose-1-phosphate cytidylyltransferase